MEVLVAHLFGLRTKYVVVFVKDEHMRQRWILCQDEVKLFFLFSRVDVRRRKLVAYFVGHRVGLLVNFLFGNREHLLEVPMDGGLEYLVAFEGPQLTKIDVNKRRGRQEHGQAQCQHEPKPVEASNERRFLQIHFDLNDLTRTKAYAGRSSAVSSSGKKMLRVVNSRRRLVSHPTRPASG